MGGYGSTRWESVRTRQTTRACLRVELGAELRRALKEIDSAVNQGRNAGARTVLRWREKRRGTESAIGLELVGLVGCAPYAMLRYTAGGTAIAESVEIAYTPQRLGGRRAWWRCPGCGARCETLYCPSSDGRDRFRCRVCHDLTYESQQDSRAAVYRLARQMGRGAGLPDFAGMPAGGLILWLEASKVYRRRAARALRRDLGKRGARKFRVYLEMLEEL